MKINRGADQWPYQQVAARLREGIENGRYTGRLPSHERLAEEMEVATMTVQRALALLKDEGLVYAVPGLGTFVRQEPG